MSRGPRARLSNQFVLIVTPLGRTGSERSNRGGLGPPPGCGAKHPATTAEASYHPVEARVNNKFNWLSSKRLVALLPPRRDGKHAMLLPEVARSWGHNRALRKD